jgi:hypothetical protein
MTLQDKFEILAKDKFLGIPVKGFEAGGREQLGYLQRAGLRSNSKLVDIGCGVLRAGYWIIGFLEPGSYCGIEPHRERLEIGIHGILDAGTLERKQPRFDGNSTFDTSVFADKFDFFLAYSIWTHASKKQIQTMLDGFLRDSTEKGKFLTTYLPAGELDQTRLPRREMVRHQSRIGFAGLHSSQFQVGQGRVRTSETKCFEADSGRNAPAVLASY